ncbi:metal-dependent hydrolase [Tundrisphaera sp. TA3]|uniref:metal-dependent hydrolase n=1 Tax=Tundrisphaera sp. TA3 TaxID=3435775 RepID=UPI003EBD2AE1
MATRLRYLGHSSLLIESDGKSILIDPYLSECPTTPADVSADTIRPDLILLSHGHFDHLGDTVAIARRTGATVVAPYELANWLNKQGVEKAEGMQPGGGWKGDSGVHVRLTPAVHSSSLADGTYAGLACGFVVTCGDGSTIYDAADTALFGDMDLIGEIGLDLAIVPIGDYYTMGPADAVAAIRRLRPRLAMPIHYNTFPPIAQDARAWAEKVRETTSAMPVTPAPGEWVEIR